MTAQPRGLKQVNVRRGLGGFGGMGQGLKENRHGHQSLLIEHDGGEEYEEEVGGRRPRSKTQQISKFTVNDAAMTP